MSGEGGPISPYVTKKLNYNYESAVNAINDAIKASDKKKVGFRDNKSEKRNQALKVLLYFDPQFEVCQSTLPRPYISSVERLYPLAYFCFLVLSHNDKVTQRLAYYHMNWITEKHLDVSRIQNQSHRGSQQQTEPKFYCESYSS